jgi:hypothetical protein
MHLLASRNPKSEFPNPKKAGSTALYVHVNLPRA